MRNCGKAAGIQVERRSRAQKEASAKGVRGYYKHFAKAKHLGYKSWVDDAVFDLVDLRKVKPRNYVTGRWVLNIKADKQGNFPNAKARWVLRGFQDKQKEYQQRDSPASTRPGFRMSCQMAASKSWNVSHIDLKTAFLQGHSKGVNRDSVYQLPPEGGPLSYVAAKLKKPVYGTYDAPRRWWNVLDKALCSDGTVPTRVGRCCYVLYSTQTCKPNCNKKCACDHKEMQHLRESWIPLMEAQLQANPSQELSTYSR